MISGTGGRSLGFAFDGVGEGEADLEASAGSAGFLESGEVVEAGVSAETEFWAASAG